jgi:nucleoside-diphosphate-sugar epimerase
VSAPPQRAVVVTGAAGLVGRRVLARLAAERGSAPKVVALDLRLVPEAERVRGVIYETGDIRDPQLAKRFEAHAPRRWCTSRRW